MADFNWHPIARAFGASLACMGTAVFVAVLVTPGLQIVAGLIASQLIWWGARLAFMAPAVSAAGDPA